MLHTMVPMSTKDGAETWSCTQCGRSVVILWKPFAAVEIVPRDVSIVHRERGQFEVVDV